MVSSKETASLKKKGKTKLIKTDQDTDVFAEVIFDPQYRGSHHTVRWATVLERLALEKEFKNIEEGISGNKDGSHAKSLRVPPYCF